MRINITFQDALRRYPKATDEVLRQIRSTKSKNRNVNPEKLTWTFEYCERTKSVSINDLLTGKVSDKKEYIAKEHLCYFDGTKSRESIVFTVEKEEPNDL